MRERPVVVPVVAAFLGLAAMVAAVVAVSLLLPGTFLDRIWTLNRTAEAGFHSFGKYSGGLIAVVGVAAAAAAIGLLKGRRWAWLMALAVFALDGAGDVVNLMLSGDWVRSGMGAAVAAVFVGCLAGRRVREYFAGDRVE